MKSFPKYIFFFFVAIFLTQCFKDITKINTTAATIIIIPIITLIISFLWYVCTKISKKILGVPLIEIKPRIIEKGRQSGGDIIRTIAVLFVPSIHFFGLSGYYSINLDNSNLLATSIRWLTLCAVPIFMIITGYFKANKTISIKHYLAIFPILLTHIIISGIRIYVDMKYHNIAVDAEYIKQKMLFFEYGWYIRLYIGMILLMPFFNIAYKGLKTIQQKEIFILTLCGLNFLGPLTENVIPESWLTFYVFGYYVIGLFIREYQIRINPVLNISLICFFIIITAFATHAHCEGNLFDWNYIGYSKNSGYSCLPVVIVSALLMILCIDIKIKGFLKFIFKLISKVSLEMYLLSQMFDGFIYPHFINSGYDFKDMFNNFFIIVGMSVGFSFISSYIILVITTLLKLPFKFITKKLRTTN